MSDTQAMVYGRYIGGAIYETKEQNGKMQFNAVIAFDDDAEVGKIEAIRDAAIKEQWPNKKPKVQDWTVREGDDEEYENTFGNMFINPKAREDKPPRCLIKTASGMEDYPDIYAGCYVAVSVSAYAYDADPKKKSKAGVTLSLRAVAFHRDGEPIGDRFSEDEFDELDEIDVEVVDGDLG